MKLNLFIFYATLLIGSSLFSQKIHLQIVGSEKTEKDLLKTFGLKAEFDSFSEAHESLNRFKDSLYKKGYFQHIVSLTKNNQLIEVTPGNRSDSITLYIKDKNLQLDFTKKKSLATTELPEFLQNITKKETDAGYPLSTTSLINIRLNDNELTAELHLERKRQRKVSNILIKGYPKFPKSYLKHYTRLDTTKTFNRSEILKKTDNLNNLLFITQTKPPEILFTKDSTNLYLYIEKNNINQFEGFIGFASDEETNKLRIDGVIDLQLTNNFNYGESLGFYYKSNGDNQQTLELSARLPYLFKSPISLSANINLFRQDSLFSNTSQSLTAEFQTAQNLSINTTYNHTSSNVTTSTTDSNPFTKNSLSLGLTYTNRKNYILLPQITQFKFNIGGARRIDKNTTSQFFTTIEAIKTFTISSKQQLYLKSNTSILTSEDYYENELFRFGGIKTLRGFKENSIFSSTYSTLLTEFRQVLTNGLTINSIFDLAYSKNHINNSENYLYSIGLGASIVTQSGTLKLNFANGTTLGNTPKFSNTILHLTLLTQF